MKVGNLVDGLAVVDVKRINKMNLIQFTKAVSEYIEQGYKLDVHSSRQVGLVLQMDMYKTEANVSVCSTREASLVEDSSKEDVVSVGDGEEEAKVYDPKESTLTIDGTIVEGFDGDSKEDVPEPEVAESLVEETKEEAEVEQTPPVKKAARTKKQTT